MSHKSVSGAAKAWRRMLTLFVVLAAMGMPLYAISEPVPTAQELSIDQILARHFAAAGGERQLAVQSTRTVGRAFVMGMESAYTRWTKRPNKVLLEIYVQGMTGVQAFDGENAWWFMPFMGQAAAEPMPADMAQQMIEQSDFDGALINPAAKGHAVELLGVEKADGADAYKLQVTLATGGRQIHYVDPESFYVVRVEAGGQVANFKEYRLVDGLPVPTLIEMMGPMGEQIIHVNEVEYDVGVEDARFRMQ